MAKKQIKEVTYLGSPCKRGHSGRRYISGGACWECHKQRSKTLTRSLAQLQRMRVISREWYLRNKDIRPEKQRARRLADVNSYKEGQRKSYLKHRAVRLEKGKKYYENNKEKFNAKVAKRRAMKLGVGGAHTAEDIKKIFEKQRGRCAACRKKLSEYHRDHILPLVLGGDNGALNIQLLCPPCNLRKHAKHPVEFMQEIGFLI